MKVKEAIEHLSNFNPEETLCITWWDKRDVIKQAEELEMVISDDDIEFVLNEVESTWDASVGISWDNFISELEFIKEN
jgi:hypothetical protein